MRKQRYNWSYNWNYIGDWYLLRAKFMNDWYKGRIRYKYDTEQPERWNQ